MNGRDDSLPYFFVKKVTHETWKMSDYTERKNALLNFSEMFQKNEKMF